MLAHTQIGATALVLSVLLGCDSDANMLSEESGGIA
jgi:hypothetical protein